MNNPTHLGTFNVNVEGEFKYQYLPIKESDNWNIPDRLTNLIPLFNFVSEYVERRYKAFNYVYLTAKRSREKFNREGWHIDGFNSDDVNIVWCDSSPTVFNYGAFQLSEDDDISLKEMEEQACESNNYFFPPNTILDMRRSVHKVGPFHGMRTFIKLSFSDDKYNLEGNSINEINKNWVFHSRKETRNIPQVN